MKYLTFLTAILTSGLWLGVNAAEAGGYHSARAGLGHQGYHSFVATDRRGPVYGFSGCKNGHAYRLRVNARGRVLRRHRYGACRVSVSAPRTRVRVHGRHVRVKAPYTRVRVRGRHVKVNAPYTRVRVGSNRVRVRNPWVNINIRF